MKNNNVLILAAHPDDEAIGCGGTIKYFLNKKYNVGVVFFTDGISSRTNNKKSKETRIRNSNNAKKILGYNLLENFMMKDNQLDTYPLLEIVNKIENIIKYYKPSIVFTHWSNDLNIDHKIVYDATVTATRPYPSQTVQEVYCYEVLSNSDWSFDKSFNPNYFVNIE